MALENDDDTAIDRLGNTEEPETIESIEYSTPSCCTFFRQGKPSRFDPREAMTLLLHHNIEAHSLCADRRGRVSVQIEIISVDQHH